MLVYKGYTGVFEFDAELEVFAGHVVDLRDQIYFEGESVEELKTSMQRTVAVAAASKGESINSWLVEVVKVAAEADVGPVALTRRERRGGDMSAASIAPLKRPRNKGKKVGAGT